MTGATLQLHSVGKENKYLTQNPQISFFKAVYKNISNFAMQSIDLYFEKVSQLSFNSNTKLKLILGRNGDLIHKLLLHIQLPAIHSNTDNYSGISPLLRWSPNIGEIIVKNARILIGGEEIESLDSESMHIYNRLTSSSEKNSNLDYMYSNKNTYTNPTYYRKNAPKETFSENESTFISPHYNTIPAIPETNIVVPLPFWFHKDIGQSLPIANLNYHDVVLEIEIRSLKELLVGIEDIYPIPGDNSIKHSQFKNVSHFMNNKETLFEYFKEKTWNINPILQTEYIFLDKDLQNNFKYTPLQYLVEPVRRIEQKSQTGKIKLDKFFTAKLPRHQCKEIHIIARRDDYHKRNDILNFTNFDSSINYNNYYDYQNYYYKIATDGLTNETTAITGTSLITGNITNLKTILGSTIISGKDWNILDNTKNYNMNPVTTSHDIVTDLTKFLNIWNHREYYRIPSINKSNQEFFTDPIINSIKILFNTTERLEKKDADYFTTIQPYMHHESYIPGLHNYSFCLNPDKFQPSGKCNLAHINKMILELDIKDTKPYDTENYAYDIIVYLKYYNILEIKGGMGDLLFRT